MLDLLHLGGCLCAPYLGLHWRLPLKEYSLRHRQLATNWEHLHFVDVNQNGMGFTRADAQEYQSNVSIALHFYQFHFISCPSIRSWGLTAIGHLYSILRAGRTIFWQQRISPSGQQASNIFDVYTSEVLISFSFVHLVVFSEAYYKCKIHEDKGKHL